MADATVVFMGTRLTDAVATTGFGNDGGGGGISAEPDIVLVGTAAQSRKVSTSRIGRDYTHGTNQNMLATHTGTLGHYLAKVNAANSAALLARTAPALGLKIGSSSANYYDHYVFGNDNYPPRGGFQVVPISAVVEAYRGITAGIPVLNDMLYVSLLADFSATSKSENLVIDAVDLSRGLTLHDGVGASVDGVFTDFYDFDEGDNTTPARYMHWYREGTINLVNGAIVIGQSAWNTSAETVFQDATGGTIVWQNGMAATGYHRFVLDCATSGTDIDITGWAFQSIGERRNTFGGALTGDRVSEQDTRLVLEVLGTAGAVDLTDCSFTNLSQVILTSAAQLTGCTLETEHLTQGSGNVEACTIRTTSVAEVATLTDPTFGTTTDLNNTAFAQFGTGHAIQLDDGLGAETAPSHQANGTPVSNIDGSVTPTWPTHVADDVGFLVVQSNAQDAVHLDTAQGFELVGTVANEADTNLGSRLTVWWKRATSGAEAAPIVEGGEAQHLYAVIVTYRGCTTTGLPWHDFEMDYSASAGTSMTWPSFSTRIFGETVVNFGTRNQNTAGAWVSGETNANLTSITSQFDNATADGDGGGITVWDGTRNAGPGSISSSTATDAASSYHTYMVMGLRGVAAAQARGGHQGTGSVGASSSGTTVAWPTHTTDDIGIIVAETIETVTPTITAGWTQIATVATTNDTRITAWWKRAISASETDPTVTASSDHVIGQMVTYRGCRTTGNPYDAVATSADNTSDTSVTFPAITTLYDSQLIVGCVAHGEDISGGNRFSGYTNANLSSITERFDSTTVLNDGGGIALFDAVGPATAGTTGTTTATQSAASERAHIMLAMAAQESTYTLTGITGTTTGGGYGANGTSSAALWVPDAGGQYAISLSGSDTPTWTSAGAGVRFIASTDLTFTGLVNPTEVRVYDAGTTDEVDGTENVTTGTVTYSIDSATFTSVDVRIITENYINQFLEGIDMTSGDVSIPIVQIFDRVFDNP